MTEEVVPSPPPPPPPPFRPPVDGIEVDTPRAGGGRVADPSSASGTAVSGERDCTRPAVVTAPFARSPLLLISNKSFASVFVRETTPPPRVHLPLGSAPLPRTNDWLRELIHSATCAPIGRCRVPSEEVTDEGEASSAQVKRMILNK
ncbi:hypothetical protein E2C01_055260 [Portunus trituberculatus]|uniref:Uncharacterized protein n=1 Tax=Portunus trituberculatus TaxID=210409 RepID=A0A5B7GUC4_PORTR|nr:hypothetical protein [Portunus trituberculatus]